jgi:hypothetical protein
VLSFRAPYSSYDKVTLDRCIRNSRNPAAVGEVVVKKDAAAWSKNEGG